MARNDTCQKMGSRVSQDSDDPTQINTRWVRLFLLLLYCQPNDHTKWARVILNMIKNTSGESFILSLLPNTEEHVFDIKRSHTAIKRIKVTYPKQQQTAVVSEIIRLKSRWSCLLSKIGLKSRWGCLLSTECIRNPKHTKSWRFCSANKGCT